MNDTTKPKFFTIDFTEQHEAKLNSLPKRINKCHNKLQKYFGRYPLLFIYSMIAFFGGEKMEDLNHVIKYNAEKFGDEKRAFLALMVTQSDKYVDFIKELTAFEKHNLE